MSARRTTQFVTLAWLALSSACSWYPAAYAADCPYMDEWELSGVFTGRLRLSELTLGQHNEHRYPLGQLTWYGLTAAADDFRAGAWASVGLMAGLAWGLMRVAARVGDGPHPADVLFPALLLHFGHSENWLMGYQVVLTLPLAAAGGVLAAAVLYRPDGLSTWAAAGCLLVAMTGGGYGVAFAVPVAGWVAYLGWRVRRERPGTGVGLALSAAAAVGYAGFCLATMRSADRPPFDPGRFAVACLEVLGATFGAGVGRSPLAEGFVLVVDGVVIARLGWVAITDPAERPRALGILAVLVGLGAAGAAVAAGRGGFTDRHALPMAVHGAAALLALRAYPVRGIPRWAGAVVGVGLAGLIVAGNWEHGRVFGRLHRFRYDALKADVRAGMPVGFLAEKHLHHFFPRRPEFLPRFVAALSDLRGARIGWFRETPPTPEMVEVPGEPFPAGPGQFVDGARVTFRAEGEAAWVELVLEWPGGRAGVFTWLDPTDGDRTAVFWVNDRPESIGFRVNGLGAPAAVVGVDWLVPAGS